MTDLHGPASLKWLFALDRCPTCPVDTDYNPSAFIGRSAFVSLRLSDYRLLRTVPAHPLQVLDTAMCRRTMANSCKYMKIVYIRCSPHVLSLSRMPFATRRPSVPDKAEVHAQAPVLPAALQAHEDAVGDGCPLRVLRVAVHACLQQHSQGSPHRHWRSKTPHTDLRAPAANFIVPIVSDWKSARADCMPQMQACIRAAHRSRRQPHLVLGPALQLPQDPEGFS